MNATSIMLNVDVTRNPPNSNGNYNSGFELRNISKNANGRQRIRHFTNNKNINLMDSSIVTNDLNRPEPGNKIELYSYACYPKWFIQVNSATLKSY
jgi:hypothetical protein